MSRSGSACELCGNNSNLEIYTIPPFEQTANRSILVCETCRDQLTGAKPLDANHWRCLNNSMWSTEPPVQIVVWRLLHSLRHEGWPQDLLDMLYLDDEVLALAKSGIDDGETETKPVHKDSNGNVLTDGDTIVLVKDLDVKGAGFTAKRGTAVRGIRLVEDNPGQIEGRINGQHIVILTQFVKKS